jgi:predicted nuclease of predicted toxin-antitoxin system
MNFKSCKFIADENIPPLLTTYLKELGVDIIIIEKLQSDLDIIAYAHKHNRAVITQDADFGKIVFTAKVDFTGIIYLRPGHISAAFHKTTIQAIISEKLELLAPFILVAENQGEKIKLRLRNAIGK